MLERSKDFAGAAAPRRRRAPRARAIAAAALAVAGALAGALAGAAQAREVSVHLTIDHELLRQALLAHVYNDAEHTLRASDGSGCNEVVLAEPKLETSDGRLRLESRGEASGGFSLFGFCLFPVSWQGIVEVFEEPEVVPPAPLVHFRVVDSNLYGPDGKKQLAAGAVWDRVKPYVQPRLAELEVDLGAPLRDLREVLPLFLDPSAAERSQHLLDTLRVADAEAVAEGIRVDLRFDVMEPTLREADVSAPEPPLSDAEVASFAATLQRVDAFTTFVVKYASRDSQLEDVHAALLEVLLDERYDLLDALTDPSRDASPKVRALFLASWERLAPVLRHVSPKLPGGLALRYLSFIAAGDALRAIDDVGPGSGLDISADGLRRLARMIAPTATEDPLAYSSGVDPELRALLGFGAPLAAPEDEASVPADATPAASPAMPGTTPAPSGEPAPTASPSPMAALAPPGDSLADALSAFAAGAARGALHVALALSDVAAAEASVPAGEAPSRSDDVLRRLNRWAPTRADLNEYLPLVRGLLREVADARIREDALDARTQPLFRALVPATAWQETCWRQFVKQGGKIVPIRSPAGAVGIMQVNQTVWRGFYDVGGLQRDIRYNARAGTEILSRYLRQYVLVGKAGRDVADLAGATYTVFNGGPGQLRRFEKGSVSARERAIDRAFREKFARIHGGDSLAVADCFGD